MINDNFVERLIRPDDWKICYGDDGSVNHITDSTIGLMEDEDMVKIVNTLIKKIRDERRINSELKQKTVKINRYEIFDNGTKGKRIYDYLTGESIVFLGTNNEELNIVLAEVVLDTLNKME